MHPTLPLLQPTKFPGLNRDQLITLQVNLGYRCNQSCLHCHVNAGPTRSEMMDNETLMLIPEVLVARNITTLDLTGGAPELHEGFRSLVKEASALGIKVIDRCNLTILYEPGQGDLATFLARQQVEISASLPFYSMADVDKQRGDGVFDKSILALQELNSLGYGCKDTGLVLNLAYNPQGPSLPPDQTKLQSIYKKELYENFGILFNELFTITNMPIQRFGSTLVSKGQFNDYIQLLKDNFTDINYSNVMCRNLISVDWKGYLFDCDFNQQLDLELGMRGLSTEKSKKKPHLRDLLNEDPLGRSIQVADHCYGCTAGHGSSCNGTLQK